MRCRAGIPRKNLDPNEKFFYDKSELSDVRQSGDAEPEFRLGNHGNPHFADGYFPEPLANLREVSFDDVADRVGVEQIADGHLEQVALLRRGLASLSEEILGNSSRVQECEKIAPRLRTAGKDNIPCFRVAAHKYFRAFEAILGRKPYSLAAAVAEKFGGL